MSITEAEVHAAQAKEDWRHRFVGVLAKDVPYAGPGTQEHKAGAAILLTTALTHDGKPVFFSMPWAPGILLGIANDAYTRWRQLNPLLRGEKLDKPNEVFDTLSAGMTAVVAAYTAIEGAANDMVPEPFVYKRKTRKGKAEELDHDEILRRVPLAEKLTEVLPTANGIKDTSQLKEWTAFRTLEDIRHRVIHTKKQDVESWKGQQLPTPDTIWSQILDPKLPNPALTAKAVIAHVTSTRPMHSVKHAPF